MPVNLTGATIASTYDQLLHVDDGPTATEKTVYSGTGVATAMKVGTTSASVGNVQLTGNTIRTLDTNGNLILAPNGTGSVAMSKVAITGGTISGITDLAIADGGTGASNASDARGNLGLGTMATQAASLVAITGGAVVATTALGYAASTYGTVTQATDKSTAVTLNSLTGRITMDAQLLASNTDVIFTLNNSALTGNDLLVVNIAGGGTPGAYRLDVCCNTAGAAVLKLRNTTGGSLSEAVQIIFVVIKVG